MIIVEGADNCGKTTLIEQLRVADPKLKLLKRKRFKPGKSETMGSSYLEVLIPPDGDRLSHGYSIVDRLLASECIYGDLLRNGSRITPKEKMEILDKLVSYQALVVHCDIPNERILETWSNREQLYPEHAIAIAEAYRERIRNIFVCLPVIRYDWTAIDATERRDLIVRVHREIQQNLRFLQPDTQVRLLVQKRGLDLEV